MRFVLFILLLSATSNLRANSEYAYSFKLWRQAINCVLAENRNNNPSITVSDSALNCLVVQIADEREKIKSDTLILVMDNKEDSFITYIPQKNHILEICLSKVSDGDIEIKKSSPLNYSLTPSLWSIYRPVDLLLLYAKNWNFPIPEFIENLIPNQFGCERPRAFRIIKSNDQFLIQRYNLERLHNKSVPVTTTHELQWTDEITSLIRDSICCRNLIPKWPNPEWLSYPLFSRDEAQTFFSSDTITIYVQYDYIFPQVSIVLYDGIYEKHINILRKETDNKMVVDVLPNLTKPDFSDIFNSEPFELTYFYIINWDFNIPEFILDRGGHVHDDYTRDLAFRIIRQPDNTFIVQNCPIDLSTILNRN